jgi:hypothetical protein
MASIEANDIDCVVVGCDIVLGCGVSGGGARDHGAYGDDGGPVHDVRVGGHVDPVRYHKTLMRAFLKLVLGLLRRLDAEKVSTFQTMYYCLFTATAVLLIFFPDFHLQYVSSELGRPYYDAWLFVNLICPSLTLIGRRFTTQAAHTRPGQPNSAYGAAWLQFCGDIGVWGNILVYVTSMILTGWWTKEIYVSAFLMMGVAGGGMFTARSARRILQIDRRNRSAARGSPWTT